MVTGCKLCRYATAAAANGLMASAQGASMYWLSGAFLTAAMCAARVSACLVCLHTRSVWCSQATLLIDFATGVDVLSSCIVCIVSVLLCGSALCQHAQFVQAVCIGYGGVHTHSVVQELLLTGCPIVGHVARS
jgi:hypothetical protein